MPPSKAKPSTTPKVDDTRDDTAAEVADRVLARVRKLDQHDAAATEPAFGEKIGTGIGSDTDGPGTFLYDVVVLPVGPDAAVKPGPDTAALTAAINAGYRPVGEATASAPKDHPDGESKVVTWSVPVVKVKAADVDPPFNTPQLAERDKA